jgi:lipopolysaccharide/colanic/teichoic acid biosynthesis glycosyltransferase
MSLVGPRPERPEFTRVLQRSIPCYAERHHLAPGLTGLAQITLGYHAAPAGKLAHDLDWVRHPGVWRYLHIALATPWSIVRGPADRDSDPAFDHPGVIDLTEPEEVASSVA